MLLILFGLVILCFIFNSASGAGAGGASARSTGKTARNVARGGRNWRGNTGNPGVFSGDSGWPPVLPTSPADGDDLQAMRHRLGEERFHPPPDPESTPVELDSPSPDRSDEGRPKSQETWGGSSDDSYVETSCSASDCGASDGGASDGGSGNSSDSGSSSTSDSGSSDSGSSSD